MNSPACGSSFPPTLETTGQEHRWTPAVSRCKCAVGLPPSICGLGSHRDALGRFCERACIDFGPTYSHPVSGEQGMIS
jgi:hypothetical protein